MPSPAQAPLIAPMIGLGTAGKYEFWVWKSARDAGSKAGAWGRAARALAPASVWMAVREFMSAPAQKPRPAPVSTITRTAGSSVASRMAARTSRSISPRQAFSRSGRFRVITATPSSTL